MFYGINYDKNDVSAFIEQFKSRDDGSVTATFMDGQCYWFAFVLGGRFTDMDLVYEPIEGHWLATVAGQYFDIRGDVTHLYAAGHELYSEDYALEIRSIVEGTILKIN